jgi:hypothetical protein
MISPDTLVSCVTTQLYEYPRHVGSQSARSLPWVTNFNVVEVARRASL